MSKNLLENYCKKIDELAPATFNEDQKILAKKILEKADEKDLQNIFQMLIQRIKIGFTFDVAPTYQKEDEQSVALLKKDENRSFKNYENTSNIENTLIIGENYDALKNLLVIERERETSSHSDAYYDVIYIDPPYNTESAKDDGNHLADEKSDIAPSKFVYRDKFSRNGWLNMLNERLRLAKQLLKDDGVIFVSIDDNEQAYLKVLMDEIFGEENFAGTIIHNKSNAQNDAQNIEKNHDYIHCYIKKIDNLLKTSFDSKKEIKKDKNGYYVETGMTMGGGISGTLNGRPLLGWTIYYNPLTNDIVPLMDYDINLAKASNNELAIYKNDDNLLKKGYQIIRPPKNGQKLGRWKWSYEKVIQNLENIIIKKSSKNEYNFSIYRKTYLTISDNDVIYKDNKYYVNHQNKVSSKSIINLSSGLGSITLKNLFGLKPFSNPKSVQLIKYLINLKTWKFKDCRILDFYAGSGTTGHAVMELNKEDGGKRTYTLVTNNENNIGYDVCYERLYRVNNGIGANNETFEWIKKNKPYKQNLNVFSIDYYDTSILKKDDNDSIAKIKKALNKEIEEFGIIPSANFNVDIYYDLLSLKPILKVGK